MVHPDIEITMNTRTMEPADAGTLAQRIRELSATTGGSDDGLRWDKPALHKYLRLCFAGAGIGIAGAAAIGLWFRFGVPIERPIEVALSAISIAFLVLAGAAIFNAIGPLLSVFSSERMERVLMEEQLATAEATANAWQDIAFSSAMLVRNAIAVQSVDEEMGAFVQGNMDAVRLTSLSPPLNPEEQTGPRFRTKAGVTLDIELVRMHCDATPDSPFRDLTVAAFEANPRRALREIRQRLEAMERQLSRKELLEVDAKLKYAIIVLDTTQDEQAG